MIKASIPNKVAKALEELKKEEYGLYDIADICVNEPIEYSDAEMIVRRFGKIYFEMLMDALLNGYEIEEDGKYDVITSET